jgi:hypothetical protein
MNALVLGPSPNPLAASQRLRHQFEPHAAREPRGPASRYEPPSARKRNRDRQETARRFRPLARRRFRTRRPAFVLIRTRNP